MQDRFQKKVIKNVLKDTHRSHGKIWEAGASCCGNTVPQRDQRTWSKSDEYREILKLNLIEAETDWRPKTGALPSSG